MKIDIKVIEKLSALSKLKFSEKETNLISEDLSKMLDFINKLKEVDTADVEPLIHMNEEINNWREDQLDQMLGQSKALENSPVKDGTYFKIPKVLDKS
jgi:aspartyl-tRNA(Asn)/glutamyl-tRNA(Gln) amidotransferase subunit C